MIVPLWHTHWRSVQIVSVVTVLERANGLHLRGEYRARKCFIPVVASVHLLVKHRLRGLTGAWNRQMLCRLLLLLLLLFLLLAAPTHQHWDSRLGSHMGPAIRRHGTGGHGTPSGQSRRQTVAHGSREIEARVPFLIEGWAFAAGRWFWSLWMPVIRLWILFAWFQHDWSRSWSRRHRRWHSVDHHVASL